MIIEILKSIILGIAEGVTEFLPISSTGHLIIVNQWISFGEAFTYLFDIVIQLGAILSVVVLFWDKIWPVGKGEEKKKEIIGIWYKTFIGVIPAIILGGLLGGFIEEKLFSPLVVATALIIGGIILIFIEKRQSKNKYESIFQIPIKIAFFIGLVQTLAMIPGTSRAAATIIGAVLLGVSRVAAVEFSFFLAIPTMLAASTYSLLKHGSGVSSSEAFLLLVGFVTAFFVALAVIRFFIKYIKSHDFKFFGYYRIILGLFVLAYFFFN